MLEKKNKNKTKANKVTKTNKQTNKNKSSTVVPELVTLDCSLTRYRHLTLSLTTVDSDWLGLYVRSSILKDLTKIGKPPCNASHEN